MEVKSSDSGKVDCSLSDVEGFPGKDQELNDFFYNMKEDYSTSIFSSMAISTGSDYYLTKGQYYPTLITKRTNLSSIKYLNEIITTTLTSPYHYVGYVNFQCNTSNSDNFYYKLTSLVLNNKNINRPFLVTNYSDNFKNKLMIFYNNKHKYLEQYNTIAFSVDSKKYIRYFQPFYNLYRTSDRASYRFWSVSSTDQQTFSEYFWKGQFINKPLIDTLSKIYDKTQLEGVSIRCSDPGKPDDTSESLKYRGHYINESNYLTFGRF